MTTARPPGGPGRRSRQMRRAGQLLDPLVRRTFRQRGFIRNELVTRWPEIVGPTIAASCMPLRLTFPPGSKIQGKLQVRVESGFATILAQEKQRLIERINQYHGYQAVADMVLIQGPVSAFRRRHRRAPDKLDSDQQAQLDALTGPATHADLKAALTRLGTGILANSNTKR